MKYITRSILILFLLSVVSPMVHAVETGKVVKATWYGKQFHGRLMANGKPFNMHDPSIVAHKTLPINTLLKAKNAVNGKTCVVKVQDRGPYNKDSQVALDFSRAAAERLGFIKDGKAKIVITVLALG